MDVFLVDACTIEPRTPRIAVDGELVQRRRRWSTGTCPAICAWSRRARRRDERLLRAPRRPRAVVALNA